MAAQAEYELVQVNEFSYRNFMVDGQHVQGQRYGIIVPRIHLGLECILETAKAQNFSGTVIEYRVQWVQETQDYTITCYLPF